MTECDRDALGAFAVGSATRSSGACSWAGCATTPSASHADAIDRGERDRVGSYEFAPGALRRASPAGTVQNGNGLHGLLTRRELEVVAMLAEGETNARIAQRLVVSEDTVSPT